MSLKQLKINVTPAQLDHIQNAAQSLGMTQSDLIRYAVSEYLRLRGEGALPDDLNPQGVRRDYQARGKE